jgi:putative flippase GtrA
VRLKPAFVAFVLIGGFASGVNLVSRILIDLLTSYEVAIILAFPIATTTAFLLNRMFVFKPTTPAWRGQFVRFLVVNVAMLAQVFIISVLFARLIFPAVGMNFHADTVAHAIGLVSPIFTSYWMHKHFSFAADTQAEPHLGQQR